jgi:hypothetical protein
VVLKSNESAITRLLNELKGPRPGGGRLKFLSLNKLASSIRDIVKIYKVQMICFSFVFFFLVWTNPGIIAFPSGDTGGYTAVSHSLYNESSQDRPIIFPLIIKILRFLADDHWPTLLVLFQYLLLCCISLMAFSILQKFFRPWLSGIFSVVIGISPGIAHSAAFILPELILAFFITIAWYAIVRMFLIKQITSRQIIVLSMLAGGFSGLAALSKPVWILGFIPISLAAIIVFRKNLKHAIQVGLSISLTHILLCALWISFLYINFGQLGISRIGTVAINVILVRAGLTHYAEGTEVYNYFKEHDTLEKANQLTWDNFALFREVLKQMPWSIRYDKEFAKKIFAEDISTYFFIQLSRLPIFFRTRCSFLPNENRFPKALSFLNYIYMGSYNKFHWIFIPLFLLISVILLFQKTTFNSLLLLSLFMIAYYSCVVTFLTYQNPHFIRMKPPIDPLLYITAFISFCFIAGKLQSLWIKISKQN